MLKTLFEVEIRHMAALIKPPPYAELSMSDIMSGFTTIIRGIDFLVTQFFVD